MSENLGEFFSLIGKAKKEKEDEFRSLVGDLDIDSMFSQVKESIKEDKKKKKKEEKQIKALESWLFAEEPPEEKTEEVVKSPIVGVDETQFEEWIQDEWDDEEEKEEEVTSEVVEETEEEEVEDTVDHALKILETIKSKEEVRENLEDPEILKIRRELEYLKNLVNAQGGGGEVRLEFLDDVDRDTAKVDGKFLKYDSSTGKFIGADASGGGGGGGNSGITIKEEGSNVGTAGSVTSVNFVGDNITASAAGAGATITLSDTPQFDSLKVTGLTTFSGATTLESTNYLQLKDNTNIIGHNGVNNLFRFTDTLQFRGDTLFFQEYDGTEYVRMSEQFGVQIKHQGSTKLQIESDGITVTGTINDHTIPSGSGTFALTSDVPTNNNELTNGAGYITTSFTNTNQLTNGAGYITTSFTNTNQLTNGAGFITASDDITGTAAGLSGTPNITVGIVTATSAIVGSAVTINSLGLNVSGVVTATTFVGSLTGSASSLSGVSSSFLLDYNNFTNTPTIPTNNNELTNGAGYITTSFTNTNQLTNGAGFITASDSITGTAAGLSGSPDIGIQNITGVAATFTGDLTIEGTLTYEDVTNIDSVGFGTFGKGIEVQGAGSTTTTLNVTGVSTLGIVTSSSIFSTGIITATSFVGDGSNLSGLPSSDLVNDTSPQLGGNLDLNSNNITGTGDIDFTGSLTVTSTDTGSSAAPELTLYRNSASPAPGDYLGQLMFKGENSNGGQENYAKITGKITDETLGTEDGLIETAIKGNGSFTIVSRQRSDELQLLNGVGISVDGDSTFTGDITANGNIVGDDSTNISGINSVTATSFYGDGSNLTGVARTDNIITGTAATFNNVVNVGTGITLDATSGIITATNFFGTTQGQVSYITATETLTNKTLRNPTFESGANSPEFLETRYVNATQQDFVQLYTGGSTGSYFTQGEYQKIATITPSGNFQNYTFNIRLTATSASNYQIVNFTGGLRANTLPDLDFTVNFSEEHNGVRFIEPKLWTKETTTAGFILAFEYVHSSSLFGGVNVEATIIPRSSAQRANVVFNTTQDSEQDNIDTGFTERDPTLTLSTVNGIPIFGTQFQIEGSTDNDFETTITSVDATADRTITFPDSTGTVALVGDTVDSVTLNNGLITTGVSTTTATDQTSIDSFSASTYRSAKYNVQVTRGSEYQTTEISVIHDGSDSYGTEYATIKTGVSLATFSTDVSGGNVRLLATPSSATSTVFKLFRTTTEV